MARLRDVNSNTRDTNREHPDDEQSIQGVGSLLGGDVASLLDGESVILPSDDDMSSVNTTFPNPASIAARKRMNRGYDVNASENYDDDDNSSAWMGTITNDDHKSNLNPYAAATPSSPTQETANSGSSASRHSKSVCCIPLWLTDAPKWLKLAIVVSTALLVGAIVLVVVAALFNSNSTTETLSALSPVMAPMAGTTNTQQPAWSTPAMSPLPTTLKPIEDDKDNSDKPFSGTNPGSAPSTSPVTTPPKSETSTVFYVVGGRPDQQYLTDFEENLGRLPSDSSSFMVHLGDWNSPFSTKCDEASYVAVDSLFQKSNVPVYFIPGDNEYNDCPDPDQAMDYWKQYLLNYETKYWPSPPWTVSRYDGVLDENWAFFYRGVLYIGINLVGGEEHDASEWANRTAADLEWIDMNFKTHEIVDNNGGESLAALVVFGHSDPRIVTNDDFFLNFTERVRTDYVIPTIFVHRNLASETPSIKENYQGVDDFVILVVEGGIWPPMRVEIDTQSGSFQWNQATWFR